MNIVAVIIGVCILGTGVWFSQQASVQSSQDNQFSEEPSPTQDPSIIPSPTDSATPTSLPPTKTNTPTTASKPTNTPIPNNTETSLSISEFSYPGATVVSSSEKRIELTSSEKASTITDWYKSKITALGMNAKSFVTTKANDLVVNKLVAAGKGREIKVDITTSSPNSTVKIIVEVN